MTFDMFMRHATSHQILCGRVLQAPLTFQFPPFWSYHECTQKLQIANFGQHCERQATPAMNAELHLY